jgi:hypothetical protein
MVSIIPMAIALFDMRLYGGRINKVLELEVEDNCGD